jgi:Protein of unknown function (DUF1573).
MSFKKALLTALTLLAVTLFLPFEYQAYAQKKVKTAAKAEGPRLVMKETVHDAGEAAPGSTVSHDFLIENTGSKDLKIVKVIASCGCTVASYDKVVAPGKSGKVTIKVKLYEDWANRPITQSAIVETNDPAEPYTTVVIKAQVLPKG